MKKLYILLIIPIFILSSCVIELGYPPTLQPPTAPPPVTPNSLTLNPPYVHYSSPEELDIHLEFDYPDYWIFREYIESPYIIDIGLGDPRFLTIPTLAPNQSHGMGHDFPGVGISIYYIDPDDTLASLVQPYRQGRNNPPRISLQNEYQITLDSYDAIVLEYESKDFEVYTSPMFGRAVFLIVEDKFCRIEFTIAIHERGSEFEQGYEHFFNSLKITP